MLAKIPITLCISLFTIPWIRGGNSEIVQALIGLLLLLALCHFCWSTPGVLQRRFKPINGAVALWLVWLLWTGFQLIPLPPELLATLSPNSYDIHARLIPLGIDPTYTISINPAESLKAFLWTTTLFGCYLLAATLSTPKSVEWALITLCTVGAVQAIYGTVNLYTGLELDFFNAQAKRAHGASGSFANSNHFAAYLNLCAGACLALILSRQNQNAQTWSNPLRRGIELLSGSYPILRFSLLLLVIAVITSKSRLGNVAFILALASIGALWLVFARSAHQRMVTLIAFLSIFAIDLLIISQQFGLKNAVDDILGTQLQLEYRPTIYQQSLSLAETYQLSGAGLGTFEQAYQQVRTSPESPYIDHAHNDFLQFLVETGIPGLVLLSMLVGLHIQFALVALGRKQHLYKATGAGFIVCAISGLAHATGEFHFQIPAYSLSFVAFMGLTARAANSKLRKNEPT